MYSSISITAWFIHSSIECISDMMNHDGVIDFHLRYGTDHNSIHIRRLCLLLNCPYTHVMYLGSRCTVHRKVNLRKYNERAPSIRVGMNPTVDEITHRVWNPRAFALGGCQYLSDYETSAKYNIAWYWFEFWLSNCIRWAGIWKPTSIQWVVQHIPNVPGSGLQIRSGMTAHQVVSV